MSDAAASAERRTNGANSQRDSADKDNGNLPAARQTRLVELIRERGQMTVGELIAMFGVSRDTIRRDLTLLEDRALVKRTHGGAVPVDRGMSSITPLSSRMDSHALAKRVIGAAAARLIGDGETLVLNGGSTTTYFAAELKERRDLTVVTNNLRVLPALPEHAIRTAYLLGGTYIANAQVLVRFEDFASIPRINVRTAVIGTAGISVAGFSIGSIDEAQATRAMIEISQRTIVVADRSKFNVVAFARVAELARIAYLVTDAVPEGALRRALDEAGVEIMIAK